MILSARQELNRKRTSSKSVPIAEANVCGQDFDTNVDQRRRPVRTLHGQTQQLLALARGEYVVQHHRVEPSVFGQRRFGPVDRHHGDGLRWRAFEKVAWDRDWPGRLLLLHR
jgi:hypothetical protein